jgi:hypothetical protein
MMCTVADLIVRPARVTAAVACMVLAVACSGAPDKSPAATPIGAPASRPTTAADASARQALCSGYVAALSGRAQDETLLDNPEVRTLAEQFSDLVMCGAVVRDDDTPCRRLLPEEHGPSTACRYMQSIFHELRTYPQGRSFLFDQLDWEDCHSIDSLPPTFCDAFRAAMRSGDPKDCAPTGDGEPVCRAYLALDASRCHVDGALKDVVATGPRVVEKTPRDRATERPTLGAVLELLCKQAIERRGFLAKGLKVIAESGPPREREFAKAALGQPEACAPYVQAAMQACLGGVQAPNSGTR